MPLLKTLLLVSAAVIIIIAFAGLVFKWFYPHHRSISFALIFLTLLFLNFFLFNESLNLPFFSELSMTIYLSLGLFILLYVIYILLPFDKITFSKKPNLHLKRKISTDSQSLKRLILSLDRPLHELKNSELIKMTINEADPEKVEQLKKRWEYFLIYIQKLNAFIAEYKYFYRSDIRSYKLSTRAFLIGYNAFITKYKIIFELSRHLSIYAEGVLNEPNSIFEEGIFHQMKLTLVHPKTVFHFVFGTAYIYFLSWFQGYVKRKMRLPQESLDLVAYPKQIWQAFFTSIGHFLKLSAMVTLDDFEKTTHSRFFPFQKRLIHFLGERRLASRKHFFISPIQINQIQDELEPGDIFVQRKDWELSNFGMRGFWKHAGVYTGSLNDLDTYFYHESQLLFKSSFSQYLKRRFPKVYEYKKVIQNSPKTIEVRAKGTVMLPLEELAKADHLSILRPKLSKADKLKALLFAFESYGKSYDYNFDFSDNRSLICSELVYKAYLPTKSKKGLRYGLRKPQGRYMMTPNDIIHHFDATYGTDQEQVTFVLCLSGDEASKMALFREVDFLRSSWKKSEYQYIKEVFSKKMHTTATAIKRRFSSLLQG